MAPKFGNVKFAMFNHEKLYNGHRKKGLEPFFGLYKISLCIFITNGGHLDFQNGGYMGQDRANIIIISFIPIKLVFLHIFVFNYV